ncbi:hypothetical protein EV360DRAFT_69388 [Lentinula raphanica]|nr:hypothetical protein EV360DRAFT_69388 [Lentinula raphanica]
MLQSNGLVYGIAIPDRILKAHPRFQEVFEELEAENAQIPIDERTEDESDSRVMAFDAVLADLAQKTTQVLITFNPPRPRARHEIAVFSLDGRRMHSCVVLKRDVDIRTAKDLFTESELEQIYAAIGYRRRPKVYERHGFMIFACAEKLDHTFRNVMDDSGRPLNMTYAACSSFPEAIMVWHEFSSSSDHIKAWSLGLLTAAYCLSNNTIPPSHLTRSPPNSSDPILRPKMLQSNGLVYGIAIPARILEAHPRFQEVFDELKTENAQIPIDERTQKESDLRASAEDDVLEVLAQKTTEVLVTFDPPRPRARHEIAVFSLDGSRMHSCVVLKRDVDIRTAKDLFTESELEQIYAAIGYRRRPKVYECA